MRYEDDHLLAVAKPAGVNTHRAHEHAQDGMHEWVQRQRPTHRLSVLHRLDKATSGILLFGKTAQANRTLTAQFEARRDGEALRAAGGAGRPTPQLARRPRSHRRRRRHHRLRSPSDRGRRRALGCAPAHRPHPPDPRARRPTSASRSSAMPSTAGRPRRGSSCMPPPSRWSIRTETSERCRPTGRRASTRCSRALIPATPPWPPRSPTRREPSSSTPLTPTPTCGSTATTMASRRRGSSGSAR